MQLFLGDVASTTPRVLARYAHHLEAHLRRGPASPWSGMLSRATVMEALRQVRAVLIVEP